MELYQLIAAPKGVYDRMWRSHVAGAEQRRGGESVASQTVQKIVKQGASSETVKTVKRSER